MPLAVIDSNEPLQREFQPVVDEMIRAFRSALSSNLHSLYLFGSVARKTAVPNASDINFIVVTHTHAESTTLVNTVRWRLSKKYPFVREFDIRFAAVNEVASLDSLFSWGFLLKHCSMCIYGDSLADCFGHYEPSWEIAKHWNMDIKDWLAFYRNKLGHASSEQEQLKAQMAIGKKLLRASYGVVMYRDKQWFDSPIDCGDRFVDYYPEKARDIGRAKMLLKPRLIHKRSVVGLMDDYGQWLANEYEKTEFRIG